MMGCSRVLPQHIDVRRYILIRRNGVANELEASSRNYDPLVVFDDFKRVYYCLRLLFALKIAM